MSAFGMVAGMLLLDLAILATAIATFRVASELASNIGMPGFALAIFFFPITATVGAVVSAIVWEERGPLRWALLAAASYALAFAVLA